MISTSSICFKVSWTELAGEAARPGSVRMAIRYCRVRRVRMPDAPLHVSLRPAGVSPAACVVRFAGPEPAGRPAWLPFFCCCSAMTRLSLDLERAAFGSLGKAIRRPFGLRMDLVDPSVVELPRLLARQILGELLHCLLLQRLVDRVRRAPSIGLQEWLADLTGVEGAAHALAELRLPLTKLAELRLPANRLLCILLRRQVLDDLLQRLSAQDRVHGLSCSNVLSSLDGRLSRIGCLLLRPEVLRPLVLRREGCIGNGACAKAAISCTDPCAADRAEDAG